MGNQTRILPPDYAVKIKKMTRKTANIQRMRKHKKEPLSVGRAKYISPCERTARIAEFLWTFSDKGNQIVYTTHSPYMLDLESEGAHRVRAVTKDGAGYSGIYKTAYDEQIAHEFQQDTFAPIMSASGMSLGNTFGPVNNKLDT